MLYELAKMQELQEIYEVVQHTIKRVYPKYYPKEVVDFFSTLHSKEAIAKDIENGYIGVLKQDGRIVATGCFVENHITRVYVLPEYQQRGYGTFIINTIEKEIIGKYDKAFLDASLPAAMLYEKLGYVTTKHEKYPVENGVILAYEVMEKELHKISTDINHDGRKFVPEMNSENGEVNEQTVFTYHQSGKHLLRNDAITDPNKLVRLELINEGFDLDKIVIPQRVYLLADSFFDEMVRRKCGTYKYPLGGELYVFDRNENVGFVKGNMCSPAIATQAEDLIAGGVKELIHIGFAGGLQMNQKPGDLLLTDGAFNDTAVARLYGFDYEKIDSTKILTDELERKLLCKNLNYRRGVHWTTDAGYRETWGQVIEHREKGALCVEMEGVGLFTIANYRKCLASAIYVVSDVLVEDDWKLGWGEISLEKSIHALIDMIIDSL